MKQRSILASTLLLLLLIISCEQTTTQQTKKQTFSINASQVSPWCILEFDSLDRTPTERIAMLKELGLSKYGYNWRERHLPEMVEEWKLAKENNIDITSTLVWLNADRDTFERLSPRNQYLFKNLKEVDHKPTIWISFSDNFFKKKTQEEAVAIASRMIQFVKSKADAIGCPVALYNHKGWFGNPYNQIEVLENMKDQKIKMVFNFHHGHAYIDEFPKVVKAIKPHLVFVNLNGMKKEEDLKIYPFGQGDYEFEMIQNLVDAGYTGPWGILGHIKTDDVQKVLERNISGINKINEKN